MPIYEHPFAMEGKHHTRIEATTYGMVVATCSCGWMGGDWGKEEDAAEDARLHLAGEYRPYQIPLDEKIKLWGPGRD